MLCDHEGPSFQNEDAMTARRVLIEQVLSYCGTEGPPAQNDDVERSSVRSDPAVCAIHAFLPFVAEIASLYVETECRRLCHQRHCLFLLLQRPGVTELPAPFCAVPEPTDLMPVLCTTGNQRH